MIEVGNVLKSKSPYVLLDNQLIVFDKVKSLVENADNTNIKTAVIVKGGPGTGKSVIALHLLTYFLKQGKISHYATGSKAFTETFRRCLVKKITRGV
jgi:KaiC/GvpD/RAD55 family RecA-like ATPase